MPGRFAHPQGRDERTLEGETWKAGHHATVRASGSGGQGARGNHGEPELHHTPRCAERWTGQRNAKAVSSPGKAATAVDVEPGEGIGEAVRGTARPGASRPGTTPHVGRRQVESERSSDRLVEGQAQTGDVAKGQVVCVYGLRTVCVNRPGDGTADDGEAGDRTSRM